MFQILKAMNQFIFADFFASNYEGREKRSLYLSFQIFFLFSPNSFIKTFHFHSSTLKTKKELYPTQILKKCTRDLKKKNYRVISLDLTALFPVIFSCKVCSKAHNRCFVMMYSFILNRQIEIKSWNESFISCPLDWNQERRRD